jgi:hypothetical protein
MLQEIGCNRRAAAAKAADARFRARRRDGAPRARACGVQFSLETEAERIVALYAAEAARRGSAGQGG